MNKDKSKTIFTSAKKIFPLIILMMTILMGVGYASINSIIIGFEGEAIAKEVDGIFITDANYISDVGADLTTSKILNAYQTNLSSVVALSKTNGNSSITYQITVYNSTDLPYVYKGIEYVAGEGTYDNQGITFYLSGLAIDDVIQSKEIRTFSITFMYVNNTVAANNILNSIINFQFEEYQEDEVLVSAGVLNSSSTDGNIFGANLYKYSIESISFVNHKNVPSGATSWDASAEGNNTITGWYVDSDANGSYELYLGSDEGRITFPSNASSMFSSFGSLKSIDFSNVDTSQVTNMSNMFYSSSSLTELDLSRFDTSNVTDMSYMFGFAYGLTSINLTSFDTSKVTTMYNMFFYVNKVKEFDLSSFTTESLTHISYMFYQAGAAELIKFNNATFDKVTSYGSMFSAVPSTVTVVTKDDSSKSWLVSSFPYFYGTILTVAEYAQ